MNNDFLYDLSDLTDVNSKAKLFNSFKNIDYSAFIRVLDQPLFLQSQKRISEEIADLIDLGAAVYFADRLSMTQQKDTARNIRIILPVRRPEILNQEEVIEKLKRILFWFTNDNWSFEFKHRKREGRISELQNLLPMDLFSRKVEVALWSGGLDSLAGLYNRIRSNTAEKYILIGTGGNKYIQGLQQRISQQLEILFPNRIEYVPIPIRLGHTDQIETNKRPRSRGFVFMFMGAATAILNDQETLFLYENGIGAINLPFRKVEIGLDHSRAMHPLSLIKMSGFISYLFGMHFEVINPFLYWTKAQMCRSLIIDGNTEIIFHTVSCDRRQRNTIMQCGVCSSCLLRQQAIYAAGLQDKTKYLTDIPISQNGSYTKDYFNAMVYQINDLKQILNDTDPWRKLVNYNPSLLEIAVTQAKHDGVEREDTKSQLLELYKNYVQEWTEVGDILKKKITACAQQAIA